MSDDAEPRERARERVWADLREVARPDSRFGWDFSSYIADYDGSDAGAGRVLDAVDDGANWFVTPDNNLDPLRERLIRRGTPFVMPTYGIRRGFLRLTPEAVPDGQAAFAATLDGMNRFARRVPLASLEAERESFDAMVTGASLVTRDGLRMGKGHGFFDLEWAMLREVGSVDDGTVALAAVHDVQVVDESGDADDLAADHDTIVDRIVTPTRTLVVENPPEKPEGIHWDLLTESEIRSIPPLQTLWKRAGRPDPAGEP